MKLNDDERIDQLVSAGLAIIQSPTAFCYSLDALLLAHFANVSRRDDKVIVDFCAGNGAVTMLLARQTASPVIGVEIQPRLVDMARRSVQLNHMQDRVRFIEADITQLSQEIPYDSVDYLTCNPPYFLGDATGKVNDNEYLAIARHEIHLPLTHLVQQASRFLKMKGKFYLVHRPDRLLEIIDELRRYHLVPKRVQFVHPKMNKPANVVLIEAIKNGSEIGLKWLPPLFVYDDEGNYLPDVKAIVHGKRK
ncbi:tRNA1(Val) (adenine(37)-N6)-methyltransferase [Allofustis seminis]|uniref:tRNA1(Val) (adenine(37)-N6)-methyltransferase n=1 Tax=Allofustis seminis TaxID=166939 RepID=UPI001FE1A69A|nr:tRNA1(Val) (adenine(37)-N6)-methyltransferase [Allofustis seminis]